MNKLKKLILETEPDFFKNLDENLKYFAREIRKELRDEGHVVIGITGYPNSGKSNFTAILGMLIDEFYDFDRNICFIPTSKEITKQYMNFPMYSFFHVDEASRGLHKHKWYDKVQQTLNQLYDTERENHFLCTALIMPRFQNFTENFRNFMIKYWINLPVKGLAMFYKRDDDKDCKDPWHIEESYKKKRAKWKSKRVFERDLPEQIRSEQITDCYWFYCRVPPIPKNAWTIYQELKKNSRVMAKETEVVEGESYSEKRARQKEDNITKTMELQKQGKTYYQISAMLDIGIETVRRYMRIGEARESLKESTTYPQKDSNIIYNLDKRDKLEKIKLEDSKEQKVI